jgi:asparagine synthase (glutamine-hydrolysing)
MGALIAVAGKTGENVFAPATKMLEVLSHRGGGYFGVASAETVIVKKTLEELRRESIASTVLIGHNDVKLFPNGEGQPIRSKNCTFIFEGRLFPSPTGEDARFAASQATTEDDALRFIRDFNGSFVFAANVKKRVIVGRDVVGTRPLYYGENARFCAVASERKALWNVGIPEVSSFQPGTLAFIDGKGLRVAIAKTLKQPPVLKISLQEAAMQLTKVLMQSTRDQASDVKEVAAAFSGGVDSCVLAELLRLCGVKPCLIYVAVKGSGGARAARDAARFLGLPLHIAEHSVREVEELLPVVLWLIEEPNPVNASIALPLFWVAEQAARLGQPVLMTGQGVDELFGGYARYLGDYEQHGPPGLRKRIYKDVVSSHAVNLERDDKICAFHKVELRTPFNGLGVIQLALSFPSELSIVSPTDELRKRVFRQVARNLKLPESMSERPKKAIQYMTGVSSALKKIAGKEKLTLHQYVETVFKKTRWE